MIILWNFYLSYSVALGINGIASDEIKAFFGDAIYNVQNNKSQNKDYEENIINEIENSKKIYQKIGLK